MSKNITEYSPVVVQHPFTSSGIAATPSAEGLRLLDITKSEEDLRSWQGYMKGLIDNSKSAYEIYMMVNKPYALTFLSLSEHHMSQEDFSQIPLP